MPRLVIKTHRPWQSIIAVITLSVLIALITWLLLDSSYWSSLLKNNNNNNDTRSVLEANHQLEKQNSELNDRIIMLEQTTRLDKETAVLLQKDMIALQDQIYKLKRELDFYQGVMDSARKTVGLDIHGLFIEPSSRKNWYLLKLVLTHVSKNDTVMKGSFAVTIEGVSNGQRQQLDLASLLDKKTDFGFEIKSFKRLEYEFQLADGFVADHVMVQIRPTSGEPAISKTYDWPL